MLREFSKTVKITDSKGKPVSLSHTHRFRHTQLTRFAELGLPVHVLMRYAGHATPMSMHYVAARQEHAEQEFLATAKLRAGGTHVTFSRDDHDSMCLLNQADRFLPHGWCMLPPLQTCDKGNACLTCSVFVTDASHQPALERQLAETEALINRTTTAFQEQHGRPMPEDNIWLLQRRAQARPAAPAPPADEQSALVLALTGQITRLKQQHREEVQGLRDALEQAHGENLDLRHELARRRRRHHTDASSRNRALLTSTHLIKTVNKPTQLAGTVLGH
jgi:hypothetical protein